MPAKLMPPCHVYPFYKNVCSRASVCRFNYSVFDHQIMLKGFPFIGGQPEHVVKQAHLDVSACMGSALPCWCIMQCVIASCFRRLQAQDVMANKKVNTTFTVIEKAINLANAIDHHKTVVAFPVVNVPEQPGAEGEISV